MAAVSAAKVRELGLRITRDPIAEGLNQNPAHALIHGSRKNPSDKDKNQTGGLTEGEYSKLARAARIVLFAPTPAGGQVPNAGGE